MLQHRAALGAFEPQQLAAHAAVSDLEAGVRGLTQLLQRGADLVRPRRSCSQPPPAAAGEVERRERREVTHFSLLADVQQRTLQG